MISQKMRWPISFLLLFVFLSPAAGQVHLSRGTFGNGGGATSDGNHRIVGTLGQPAVGQAAGTSNAIRAGFWYQNVTTTTSVDRVSDGVPEKFQLRQNYPNPFNPATTIEFSLATQSEVKLTVYDLVGREVAVLVDGPMRPGDYEAVFEAENLPSGVYFYRLRAQTPGQEGFDSIRKLTLLK